MRLLIPSLCIALLCSCYRHPQGPAPAPIPRACAAASSDVIAVLPEVGLALEADDGVEAAEKVAARLEAAGTPRAMRVVTCAVAVLRSNTAASPIASPLEHTVLANCGAFMARHWVE